MNVIAPIPFIDFTTSIPENDYAVYSGATTYAVGDRVIYSHNIYESLVASNVGNQPDTNTTKWVLVGATNAYKCIDEKVSSQSISSSSELTISFKSGRATKLALLNTRCSSVTMTIKLGKTVLKTQTVSGEFRKPSSWFKFFTSAFDTKTLFIFDLFYYPTATITLTFNGTANNIKVGIIVLGTVEEIGNASYGAQGGFYDYSKVATDQWGETYTKQGTFSTKFQGTVYVPSWRLSTVQKIMIDRRGIPSLYITDNSDDNNEFLTVFGLVQDFTPILENPSVSTCNLTIKGVI